MIDRHKHGENVVLIPKKNATPFSQQQVLIAISLRPMYLVGSPCL